MAEVDSASDCDKVIQNIAGVRVSTMNIFRAATHSVAPLTSVIAMLLSAQTFPFDAGDLNYTVIDATDVVVTGRASGNTEEDIIIPDTVSDGTTTYSVTSIKTSAFYDNALTSVSIGNNVRLIETSAFANNKLTSVTIGSSVTSIGQWAFSQNKLSSVIISNSVQIIVKEAFRINKLEELTIPKSIVNIGSGAFFSNSLTSVKFEGDFSTFSLDIFKDNPAQTITYCGGTKGWPVTFNLGETDIITTQIDCTPPDAPVILSVESGDGALTVRFTVPSSSGARIDNYTVTCGSESATGNNSPITVSPLSNDVQYSCSVVATSAAGTSPASAPASGKPEEWTQTGLPIWLLLDAANAAP